MAALGAGKAALRERHGVIDQHAGRRARRIALDAAAVGIGGVVVDLCELERRGVRDSGVAVDAFQNDGPI